MKTIKTGIYEKGIISVDDLIKTIKAHPDAWKIGAINVYIGVVRGETKGQKPVKKLIIDSYRERAHDALNEICQELRARKGIIDVLICHLMGEFVVGEDLVYVVIGASHREDLWPVAMESINKYKEKAEIWKKEILQDGTEYWVSGH
ncbi:MAG: molybdenum cofactor biosynthesis protein MoaE [Candidatus Helarchaeota archaeon]